MPDLHPALNCANNDLIQQAETQVALADEYGLQDSASKFARAFLAAAKDAERRAFLTDEQWKKAAEILKKNNDARYCIQWLWNNADAESVQESYFVKFLQHCVVAITEAGGHPDEPTTEMIQAGVQTLQDWQNHRITSESVAAAYRAMLAAK